MNWMSKNKVKVRKVLNTLWGKFGENLKCLNLRGVEKCKLFQKAEGTRYARFSKVWIFGRQYVRPDVSRKNFINIIVRLTWFIGFVGFFMWHFE